MAGISANEDVLVCELCCKQVQSSDFEWLEGTLLEVFKVVLIKVNFTTTQPVICTDCSKKLLEAFEYKAKWIFTEDRLFPYLNSTIDSKVDIKTVYLNISDSKQSNIMSELQICRLCIGLINDKSWTLLVDFLTERYSLEFFEKYVPDLNLNATENPIICKRCLDSLSVFMGFIEFCLGREVNTAEYIEEMKSEYIDDMKNEEYFEEEDDTKPGGTNLVLVEELEQDKREYNSEIKLNILKCITVPQVSEDIEFDLKEESPIIQPVETDLFKNASYEEKREGIHQDHALTHKSVAKVDVFECEFCTYQTKYKGTLQNHILIHKPFSEVELFKCEFCTYQTKYRGNLRNHLLIHKPFSEVEVFKCEFCSYRTKYKGNLGKHILIHNPLSQVVMFKCDFCSFVSNHRKSIRNHTVIHKALSQVVMFKCDFCSFETKHKRNLQQHFLIHKPLSEVEVFKCEFCSFESRHKKSLVQHIRNAVCAEK